MRFSKSFVGAGFMGGRSETPASCELPLSEGTLKKYFDVVTDTLAETLTGPVDEKTGNATPTLDDLTRLTAADIADVDYVLVCAKAPEQCRPQVIPGCGR
jgi:beta-glucosidase